MQPTAVNRAIEDAHGAGWKTSVEIESINSVFIHVRFHSKDVEQPIASWMLERVFLDKAFWVALGKARGWRTWKGDGLMPYISDWIWHRNWHRFIDALAEDKDPEQFFLSLEGNEV